MDSDKRPPDVGNRLHQGAWPWENEVVHTFKRFGLKSRLYWKGDATGS